ncbi:hypothetical protein BJF88_14965 [Cellulosimicrobium sp. CUA-896]|nr:hypothetical protein BJF88_14965 [Cellulosimicrobium sp. CUA-896]
MSVTASRKRRIPSGVSRNHQGAPRRRAGYTPASGASSRENDVSSTVNAIMRNRSWCPNASSTGRSAWT